MFRFHSWVRKPGESIAAFVSQFCCLSQHCKFEATLEDMLRDRFINDKALQNRLLAEPDLMYAKAVEIAQRNELAAQQVKDIRRGQDAKPINHVDHTKGKEVTCFRCGKRGQVVAKCSASAGVVCHFCGKKGHVQKVCRSKHKVTKRRKVNKVENPHNASDQDSGGHKDPINQVKVSLHTTSDAKGNSPILVDLWLDNYFYSQHGS